MSDAVNPNSSNGGDIAEPTPPSTDLPPALEEPALDATTEVTDAATDATTTIATSDAGDAMEMMASDDKAAAEDDAEDDAEDEEEDGEEDDEDEEGDNENAEADVAGAAATLSSMSLAPTNVIVTRTPANDDEGGDRFHDVDVDVDEFLSLLPKCVLPRLDKLRELDASRDVLLDEYRLERAKLENKFAAKFRPLFEERRDIVAGKLDEQIDGKALEDAQTKAQEEKTDENKAQEEKTDESKAQDEAAEGGGGDRNEQDVKGIPQFWACAMGHVDVIAESVTEADVDCLDFLIDVTSTDFPDGTGFELNFYFSPTNTYFTNEILTKRYHVPNLLTEDEPILKNVTGTTIHWKPGRSLTHREVTKKQRKKGGRGAGQIRTITKQERTDSFFHFFTPPKMPDIRDVLDEDEADAVEDFFDHDYDVAQAFRGHLIPKAVKWFTGEALDDYDDELFEDVLEEAGDGAAAVATAGGDGTTPIAFDFSEATANASNNPFPDAAPGNGENPECKQN